MSHANTDLAAATQQRMDKLLEKNSAGTIMRVERAEFEMLVAEAERLMVANARLLSGLLKI